MTSKNCIPETRPDLPLSTRLNQQCFCITLDRDALGRALEDRAGDSQTLSEIVRSRPHLFSNVSVFLRQTDITEMLQMVRARRRNFLGT